MVPVQQRALVIGLGISGKAACELLLKQGYFVVAVDANTAQSINSAVDVHNEEEAFDISSFTLVVPSPGIFPAHHLYAQAVQKGIPLAGEAQLALQTLSQKIIGITGTNGKTTVTSLIAHVLNASGFSARSLGNIGEPLSSYALLPNPEEILVVELSSYQLETMKGPFLDAAGILNITPDHLDRYGTMREYARAKWRIQHCLKKDAAPLILYENVLNTWKDLCEVEKITVYSYDPSIELYPSREYTKRGSHDKENALAAWLLVERIGITKEQFQEAAATFRIPPHRIEHVATVDGVQYFDDSKGTNLDAVVRAVEAMEGPVWLIAGGVDKGASYTVWKKPFCGRVRKIFAIGQAREKIAKEIGESCVVELVDTLQEAVYLAAKEAESGGNVLLSPGCSSFDMFRDYEHRGEEFQNYVKSLKGGEKNNES